MARSSGRECDNGEGPARGALCEQRRASRLFLFGSPLGLQTSYRWTSDHLDSQRRRLSAASSLRTARTVLTCDSFMRQTKFKLPPNRCPDRSRFSLKLSKSSEAIRLQCSPYCLAFFFTFSLSLSLPHPAGGPKNEFRSANSELNFRYLHLSRQMVGNN